MVDEVARDWFLAAPTGPLDAKAKPLCSGPWLFFPPPFYFMFQNSLKIISQVQELYEKRYYTEHMNKPDDVLFIKKDI